MWSSSRAARRSARVAGLAAAAVLSVGLLGTACSSSSPSTTDVAAVPATSGSTPPTSGSTYEIVPDAQVTAGLVAVRALAAQIKAAQTTDPASAKALLDQLYDRWFTFEGTVRKLEKNLYLQMEDGLSAIKAGVQQQNITKIEKGIQDLEDGATGYLKAHP